MEWFDKEYKNRFEKESSLEGVDSGPLWDQISKSIPQEKSTQKSPYWKWSLWVMASIIVLLSLILVQNNKIEKDNNLVQSDMSIQSGMSDVEDINSKKELLRLNVNEANKENKAQNSITDFENVTSIETDLSGRNSALFEHSSPKIKPFITNRKDINLNLSSDQKPLNNLIGSQSSVDNKFVQQDSKFLDNEINSNTNSYSVSENDNQAESISNQAEDEFKQDTKITLPVDINLKEIQKRSILEIQQLPFLKNNRLSKSKNIDIPAFAQPIIIVNKKNPWAINIQASANFFNLKYKDDANLEPFAAKVNASLGALQVGNSFRINLEYQLNNSWSISSGIEYNNYENKLSTIIVSDTTVLDDLQKIRKAQNIRSVNHHNKLSVFSIPVSIAYDFRVSSKWSLGTSIGLAYSIVRSQKGRLLSRDENIMEYSDDQNNQFGNFASFRANPYIRYRINHHMSMSLNTGFSFQNHGNDQALDLTRNSMIYSFGIGLRYKL